LPIVSHIGSSLGKFLLLVNFCAKYGSCSVGVISCLAGMVVGFGTGMIFALGGNAICQIVCQLSDLVLDGFLSVFVIPQPRNAFTSCICFGGIHPSIPDFFVSEKVVEM
jgi:hypothetical protein